MKETFKVTGIKCEGCAGSIKGALSGLNGVVAATINGDTLTLETEREIPMGELTAALSKAGKFSLEKMTTLNAKCPSGGCCCN